MIKYSTKLVRRIAGVLTAGTLIANCCLPESLPVYASGGKCGTSATWELSGNVMTFKGTGAVTDVNSLWMERKNVKKIVIEDGITSFQGDAFTGLENIEFVTCGKTLESIGNQAFKDCVNLSKVEFSSGLKTIGDKAFKCCISLEAIELPDSLTTIGKEAFWGCAGLTELTIPDSVTTIGDGAFYANNVKELTIGENVKTIGADAFNASCFSEVILPDSVEKVGEHAFGTVYSSVTCEPNQGNLVRPFFSGPEQYVMIICSEDSPAQKYAQSENLPYKLLNNEKHEHKWSEWKVDQKPTCLTEGKKVRVCPGCGEKEYESIDTVEHDWSEWKVTTDGGCEDVTIETRECSMCHTREKRTIDAPGHDWSEWKTITEATCEEDGKMVRTCSRCKEKQEKVIHASGHDWSEWTTETEATCEEDGKMVRTCANCKEKQEKDIPAIGHDWSEWTTETEATCEEDGKKVRTCANCKEKQEKAIPAIGHDWSGWKIETDATCEKDGTMVKTCHNCGEKEEKAIEATGHEWGEWETVKEPTVLAAGEQQSKCSKCGEIRTAEITKLVGYSITVTANEGGTVTPKGESLIAKGDSITITVTADEGYEISSVLLDSKETELNEKGAVSLTDIQENHSIAVVFREKVVLPVRTCLMVEVTPLKTAWCMEEEKFSLSDFKISANISEDDESSWIDITKECKPDMVPADAESEQYGSGNVTFSYTGEDEAIKAYLESGSISSVIPLYLRGDGDANKAVEVNDAIIALAAYVADMTGSPEYALSDIQKTILDVDCSGDTSLEDAVYILQYYTQVISSLEPTWEDVIENL